MGQAFLPDVVRRIYIISYICVLFVICTADGAFTQNVDTASSSDAFANIDEFLSEGLQEGETASQPGSTGSPAVQGPVVATETEGWMPLPLLPVRPPPEERATGRLVRPQGEGSLEVVVTTVREKTPRQISIMPDRIELWTQDRLLATLENGDAGVGNSFHRRIFTFPSLVLPAGYYFLTIRGFTEGFITREHKWKGKTVQIGIHDGKTTKVRETLSMFVW